MKLALLVLGLLLAPASCVAQADDATEAAARLVDDFTVVLPRLTPEQRVKLSEWINRRAWIAEPLSEAEQQELVAGKSVPTFLTGRLVALRRWLGDGPAARAVVDHLQRENAVNPVQAARRLDRCVAALAKGETPSVEQVRAALPVLPKTAETSLPMRFMTDSDSLAQRALDALANGVPTWEAELDRAVVSISQKVKLKPLAGELAALGQVLLHRDRTPGDLKTAAEALARACRDQGAKVDPLWHAWRATALGLAGRLDEEAAELEKARALGPKAPQVHLWSLVELGRSDRAADSEAYHRELRALHRGAHPSVLEDLRGTLWHCRVVKRGAALALEIIDQAGTEAPPAERRQAWAVAVAADRAAVVTLDLAYREVLAGEYAKLTGGANPVGAAGEALGGLLRGITGY